MFTRVVFVCAAVTLCGATGANAATIPSVSGLLITESRTVPIDTTADQAFRFGDGRVVVDAASETQSFWSYDNGSTWALQSPRGPAVGASKTAFDFGGGEILSLERTATKRSDGKYKLVAFRSFNNWTTDQRDDAVVDTPLAVPSGGDDCKPAEAGQGMYMHHGILKLNDGRLMATMYGTYSTDTIPADGYSADTCAYIYNKYRTIVVFSADKGKTWGNPVTVAHAGMGLTAREGFSEGDLVRAPNGDILVFMRSGGIAKNHPYPPTPLYMSRSSDEGQHWSTPVAISSYGANPNAVTLPNGVIALTFGGGHTRLMFSDDSGYTWKGSFQLTNSSSYSDIVAFGTDTVGVVYSNSSLPGLGFAITFFKVEKTGSAANQPTLNLSSSATVVDTGGAVELSWQGSNVSNCRLYGGAWQNGTLVSSNLSNISTGSIFSPTTFVLRCEQSGSVGSHEERRVSIDVREAAVTSSVHNGTGTISFTAQPTRVGVGESAFLSWSVTDARNCQLTGGEWGSGAPVSTVLSDISTGALSNTTKYTLQCESVSLPEAKIYAEVTVSVRAPASPIPTQSIVSSIQTSSFTDTSPVQYVYPTATYPATSSSVPSFTNTVQSPSQTSSCFSGTRTLSRGSRGADVTLLQSLLIRLGHLAIGNQTGYFGRLTESAVRSFQCQSGIVCEGSPYTTGYGVVGKRTRAALQSACVQ